MKTNIIYFCTLFIAIIAFPSLSKASGCDCGTITALIQRSQVAIVQQVNTNTKLESKAIRAEIVTAAQNIIGTIKTENATLVRAIMALQESNATQIKSLGIAQENQRTKDLYGNKSQPAGLCGSSTLGAGIQASTKAIAKVHKTMREKQLEFFNNPDARPLDYNQRLADDKHPGIKEIVEAIFPLEHTLTAEQVGNAQEAIKSLTNARPVPMATDEQKQTPAGETYAATRLIHQGRLAIGQEAMNAHVAYHSPTLPDDVVGWAENQWKEAGGQGSPTGLVDDKLSEAGLYKLLSQMRIGNPNWLTGLASLTEVGLLRELLLIQAMQFELTRKNSEFLDRMTFIMALDYTTKMDAAQNKELEDLYIRMIGTQQ